MRRLEELPRLRGETETIRAMVRLYCWAHHANDVNPDDPDRVCPACRSFLDYALKRLACCPYGEEKPVCEKCRIHCYKPAERETQEPREARCGSCGEARARREGRREGRDACG